jgi:flagellar assembly protein FliH
MQWSKSYLTKKDSEDKVLEFVPTKFDLGTPEQAKNYLDAKKGGSDFRMSDVVRVQTGVNEIERAAEQEKIEGKALEKLKEIQESAYREAYNLGLEDGRKKAFLEYTTQIEENLKSLNVLMGTLSNMKEHMLAFNEAHLIKLMFHMASRLTHQTMQENNPAVVEVIKNCVALAQDEEDILVKVAAQQFEYLQGLKGETGHQLDFLKNVRLEPSPDVKPGGCIIETNYGEVDARIEQRINELWQGIVDHIPKVKQKLEGNE